MSFLLGFFLGRTGVPPKEAAEVAKSPEVMEAVEKVVSSSAAATAKSIKKVVESKTVTAKVSGRIAELQSQLKGPTASSAKANAEKSQRAIKALHEGIKAANARIQANAEKENKEERERRRKYNEEYAEKAEAEAEKKHKTKESKYRESSLFPSSKGGRRKTKRRTSRSRK